MSKLYFRVSNPSDVRDLETIFDVWVQNNNPKASSWQEVPEKPDPSAIWANGSWVIPVPPTPSPDFQSFYDSLLISNCYENALQQVMTSSTPAPAAALAVLISAIQDALNDRPNIPALQASIWLFLSQINLNQQDLFELQGLLAASHLDGILNLSPPLQL